ncbi:protein-methionine-sulfoxide reductase catalytic subunit MsrP [Fulvivirgaceae bacterium BMA10]|uniref:Protein-methionine-sulfoxide reductase catalytic subunit MsrP n=1 Tax=Splendidivirga corallicola TaxID=3051826 RepID=A0ABT8KIJ0_9BACT|nr:protein-methionine-sulfoxide reductase catalytic subunit MsrP [Fulvivirgaceae bacterium BMA10]
MANIIQKKPWEQAGIKPIDEAIYYNRRQIIKQLGLTTIGMMAAPFVLGACQNPAQQNATGDSAPQEKSNTFDFEGMSDLYPATRNEKYTLDRPLTKEYDATHYNNFYEFINPRDVSIYNVYKYVEPFTTSDWSFEVSGLVKNKGKFDLEDIIKKIGLEERTYRFRCVERWAMAVPWTGFPLAKLIKLFEPKNEATHIRMVTYSNTEEMIGVRTQHWYPWPYYEGLRMDEAMNELAFIATGIFGKPLPKQNGAPMRLVVPWKYGYKNIKSIVKFEFINKEPETFWHKIAPNEYPFISNVNPEVPHPRWSQAMEYLIPDGEKRPTLKYNGYGEFVAGLYEK